MSGLYVDTSALLKRVFSEPEPESESVRTTVRERSRAGDLLVASALAWVEVGRAVFRAGIDLSDVDGTVRRACSGIARHALGPVVLDRALRVGPRALRSLDAIHLAAALDVGATEMLTFDHRLAEASAAVGLRVVQP